ncbi:hypothetical protein PAMA_012989 [Pampus argenteus]
MKLGSKFVRITEKERALTIYKNKIVNAHFLQGTLWWICCKTSFSCSFFLFSIQMCAHVCMWESYNERTALFFLFLHKPTQTSGSNKGEKLLAWPVALTVVLLQKQWLYSQHSLLLSQAQENTHTHTHSARTLALLLMLMPRSILLSSCKRRHRQVAPHHFNTLTGPRH